ncbi:MAG TPA: FAD/NAD(P)-binding protein, partial [Myxococcota bacterium]
MATALGLARADVTDSGSGAIDVELIEAGDHLGGVARGLRFAGQRFCPGPQYLWGFGPRGVEGSDDDDGAATALLAELGIDVDTIAMPADFERLQIGSASWTAAADVIDDPTLTVGDRRFLATLTA